MFTLEEIVFIVYRIIGSLPVLWFPFLGGLFAMLVDHFDVLLMDLVDLGGVGDYQELDKWLDQFYLVLFLIVAMRWEPAVRNISIALFTFRTVGFFVFLAVGAEREMLLFFPNAFEFWFIFIAGVKFFKIPFSYSPMALGMGVVAVTSLKLAHEYALHHWQIFDRISTREAIEITWDHATRPFRNPFGWRGM